MSDYIGSFMKIGNFLSANVNLLKYDTNVNSHSSKTVGCQYNGILLSSAVLISNVDIKIAILLTPTFAFQFYFYQKTCDDTEIHHKRRQTGSGITSNVKHK